MARLWAESFMNKVERGLSKFETGRVDKDANELYLTQSSSADVDEMRVAVKLEKLDRMIEAGMSESACAPLVTEIEGLRQRAAMHREQSNVAMAASASVRQTAAIQAQTHVNNLLAIARDRTFSERQQDQREKTNDTLSDQNDKVNEVRAESTRLVGEMKKTMQPLPGAGNAQGAASNLYTERLKARQQRVGVAAGAREAVAISEGRSSVPLRRLPSNSVAPAPGSGGSRVNVVAGDLSSGVGGSLSDM